MRRYVCLTVAWAIVSVMVLGASPVRSLINCNVGRWPNDSAGSGSRN